MSVFACRAEETGVKSEHASLKEQHNSSTHIHASLFYKISGILGDRWNIFRQGENLIAELKELPKVYNMYSIDPHDARQLASEQDLEVRAAIYEKFRRNISYRIIVKDGPKLSESEVNRRLQTNKSVAEKIDKMKKEGIVPNYRMTVEDELRFQEVWKMAEEIPCGVYQNRSVYLYLTHLGAADTAASAHKDYYTAAFNIAQSLLTYKNVRFRRGLKDSRWWTAPDKDEDCAYNSLGRIKSVACPW